MIFFLRKKDSYPAITLPNTVVSFRETDAKLYFAGVVICESTSLGQFSGFNESNMRKLKLQVQMSIDGFVGGPNGELDWMTWNMDEKLQDYINALTDSSSTIFLGRKMADGFIRHWMSMLSRPNDESYSFAKKMVDSQKIVFTRTLDKSDPMVMGWYNTTLATGVLKDEVNSLKNQEGKDIIVYGGANFVSNLIAEDLIDELHLFVNPVAIGNGLKIFNGRTKLLLRESEQYECGINVSVYAPAKNNG